MEFFYRNFTNPVLCSFFFENVKVGEGTNRLRVTLAGFLEVRLSYLALKKMWNFLQEFYEPCRMLILFEKVKVGGGHID